MVSTITKIAGFFERKYLYKSASEECEITSLKVECLKAYKNSHEDHCIRLEAKGKMNSKPFQTPKGGLLIHDLEDCEFENVEELSEKLDKELNLYLVEEGILDEEQEPCMVSDFFEKNKKFGEGILRSVNKIICEKNLEEDGNKEEDLDEAFGKFAFLTSLYNQNKVFKKKAQFKEEPSNDAKKAIFDSWYRFLNTDSEIIKRNKEKKTQTQTKIRRVDTNTIVFEKHKDERPPYNVPVCITESARAKPPGSLFSKESAFLFRFGNFSEQPYANESSQLAYAKELLKKIYKF